jgi:hypothetical protein
MSGRRLDWLAIAGYTVLGAAGVAFVGWVLWRLALAVDWMAAALLGFVIVFGLLMVSFDLRGERGEPVEDVDAESGAPAAKPARRGRPPKAKPAAAPPAELPAGEPPAGTHPSRGPRNRAGRAPIAEPPAKPRPRNRS